MQQQITYFNPQDELDEELNINLKKLFFIIWNKKVLIIKVFLFVLLFFVLLTFVLPKKYKVSADLYVNKTNSTNISDINPFVLDETGGGLLSMGTDKSMNNELELLQSPLVIDKVIRENNMKIKKKWGIIPNKKEGEYISTAAFLKKNISFENKKNTNVITIEYKAKKPETAYNVVNSIINNYVDTHKMLISEKSKSDVKILENEYNRLKGDLNKRLSQSGGVPQSALSGAGNITAMSAFSTSAQKALSNMQGQYIAGEKSRIAVSEDAARVANISAKLEWARLVEDMSDSSKVLVLKEPQQLRDFENSSPKLLINLILGLVFGAIASLLALIYSEITDKKLTYSKLDDEIIYNLEKDLVDFQTYLFMNDDKKLTFVLFTNLAQGLADKLKEYPNITLLKAELTKDFIQSMKAADEILLFATINQTDAKLYKKVKSLIKDMNKNIAKEILTRST